MKKTIAAITAGLLLVAGQAVAQNNSATVRVGDRVGAQADASSEFVGIPIAYTITAAISFQKIVALVAPGSSWGGEGGGGGDGGLDGVRGRLRGRRPEPPPRQRAARWSEPAAHPLIPPVAGDPLGGRPPTPRPRGLSPSGNLPPW